MTHHIIITKRLTKSQDVMLGVFSHSFFEARKAALSSVGYNAQHFHSKYQGKDTRIPMIFDVHQSVKSTDVKSAYGSVSNV